MCCQPDTINSTNIFNDNTCNVQQEYDKGYDFIKDNFRVCHMENNSFIRKSTQLSLYCDRRIRLLMLDANDAVSDLMHNWVAQRPDFKSTLRVVKMVLNTQCYQYLWLTVWFHANKSKETLKNQNRWFYNVYSAPEPRNDQKSSKNGSLNHDLLNFLYRYGIFWMPPGESSHPGGLEHV